MKASICMATYDRPTLLAKTLESIFRQAVPFDFEVIVVDDGSPADYSSVRERFPTVQWHSIERAAAYRNPAVARNVAYRAATGEIVIAQSDDVTHDLPDCIERLIIDLKPGTCLFARVVEVDAKGNETNVLVSRKIRRPLFFLGSLYRADLYAVGGNDTDFRRPAYEDKWFAECLMNGLRLTPTYSRDISGVHQYHPRPTVVRQGNLRMLRKKRREAKRTGNWTARGGGMWALNGS